MLFTFLTVVQALVATALVGVILIQKSEGGGLGVGGGNPSGLMSARGAADFLTRSTAVLAVIFVALSIVLAALAVDVTTEQKLDTSLQRNAPVDPLAGSVDPALEGAPAPQPAAPTPNNDPLAGSAAR